MFNNPPPGNSCRLWDNVKKYRRARQATDDNMAHARYMLGTEGYKHTLRIRNGFCFSTATVVARTPFSVTLYVHCLTWRDFVRCSLVRLANYGDRRCVWEFGKVHSVNCRSQWPRGLRRRSSAARLLRLWVRIPPGAWMSVVSVGCCQVEVSATDWSLVQGSPTDTGAVVVCDQGTWKTRRLKPATGLWKIQPQWLVTPGKQTNDTVSTVRATKA